MSGPIGGPIASISFGVLGGNSFSAVLLAAPGTEINFFSNNNSVVPPPNPIMVPLNTDMVLVNIPTVNVVQPTEVMLTASSGTSQLPLYVTVLPNPAVEIIMQ